jgi:hypothetical protein
LVYAVLSAVVLFILISTMSNVNRSTGSYWEPGEKRVAPYWSVLGVAVGIQIAQGVVVALAPDWTGWAIAIVGAAVLVVIALRKLWEVPWKNSLMIAAIWLIVDVVMQAYFVKVISRQTPTYP